ncbi:hypothetical protein [Variovorax sp.]|uniref:hypothetical protein n=1 Tax=Variovorax sp. TaxID=1871043 RepID=UPI00345969D1
MQLRRAARAGLQRDHLEDLAQQPGLQAVDARDRRERGHHDAIVRAQQRTQRLEGGRAFLDQPRERRDLGVVAAGQGVAVAQVGLQADQRGPGRTVQGGVDGRCHGP